MAGTLFGLGLSQQISASGSPLSGALLYIYQENSSTPVTTYSDFTLATEQTHPIEADSAGRLPQIWVADGSYRARLTTSAGIEVFDEASVTAIGASSTTTGSGGGSSTSSGFETGNIIWEPVTGSKSGWVRANGRTIGSGASSATERANSDTQTLFEYLWNNFSNTLCAVGGGRGASAEADFNANKAIATYTMRGRAAFGLDDMGNTAASVIAAGTPTAVSLSGAETVTILQANLPNVTLSSTALSADLDSTAINNGSGVARNVNSATNTNNTGGADRLTTASTSTLSLSDSSVIITGDIPLGGSGTATNKMPPYMLGTWYIRL
jgi:microcystin-dependent protein